MSLIKPSIKSQTHRRHGRSTPKPTRRAMSINSIITKIVRLYPMEFNKTETKPRMCLHVQKLNKCLDLNFEIKGLMSWHVLGFRHQWRRFLFHHFRIRPFQPNHLQHVVATLNILVDLPWLKYSFYLEKKYIKGEHWNTSCRKRFVRQHLT